MAAALPLVSFIIPLHNAERTITLALDSVSTQTFAGPMEACVYDDASHDGSVAAVRAWARSHPSVPVHMVTSAELLGAASRPLGPAFARNRAAALARGAWLCWLDADDEALPRRVELQLAAALAAPPGALVGSGFVREPVDATPRYTAWANAMKPAELVAQSWRECTLLQPTWFMAAAAFRALGGYDEAPPALWGGASGGGEEALAVPLLELAPAPGAAVAGGGGGGGGARAPGGAAASPADGAHPPILGRPPLKLQLQLAPLFPSPFEPFGEDPLFLHRHLHAGGALVRVEAPLVLYRYSPGSLSWRVPRRVLLQLKAALFEERVMRDRRGAWTIWGAGRDGKDFFKALSPAGRAAVAAWIDIDPGKVGQVYPPPERASGKKRARGAHDDGGGGGGGDAPRPIIHFSRAGAGTANVAVCVAADDRTGGGELLANVQAASAAIVAAGGAPLIEGANLFFLV
jgi:hypothetical protein